MTKTGWFVAVIIVIVAAVALLWWNSASAPAVDLNTPSAAPTENMAQMPTTDGTDSNATAPAVASMAATVSYNGSAFSPASVTIAKGGTVTFTDTAGATMWVASGMHPVHTGYGNTTLSEHCAPGYTGPAPFDQCKAGSTYSFTFDKVGSWGYHDHKNSS